MDCECKSVFNRLSKADRLKLRGAALSKTVSGFIRDDTIEHPARYPFYAAYLVVIATPLPLPFVSTLTLAATVAWARYSKSPHAQKLNARLKEAFNEAALVCDHKDYIVDPPEQTDLPAIRNAALAWHTTKRCLDDTMRATGAAWNALKDYIIK